MEWYKIALLIGVGIIAGFINTLAGSGSLLTLPLLVMFGLSPTVANGSNRIAIFFQSLVSVRNFKKHHIFTFREGLVPGIPVILGSVAGAVLGILVSQNTMLKSIQYLLIVMIPIVIFKPEKFIKSNNTKRSTSGFIQFFIFFLIGIYGGFIQAGVGLFLLTALVLGSGYDLVKANALKNFLVFLYTPIALIIYIFDGQVNYLYGFVLTIGNVIGAYIASMMAIRKGTVFVRYFLIMALIAITLKLFGLF